MANWAIDLKDMVAQRVVPDYNESDGIRFFTETGDTAQEAIDKAIEKVKRLRNEGVFDYHRKIER